MTAPFVTSLGVRPGTIVLPDAASSGDNTPGAITLRVHSAEVWDGVRVTASAETPVRSVKRAALAALMPDVDAIDAYVVKLHGNEIRNEDASLATAGVTNGATLLVMSRRRRAVR